MQIARACIETWITEKACITHSKTEKWIEILIKILRIKSIREPQVFPCRICNICFAIAQHFF